MKGKNELRKLYEINEELANIIELDGGSAVDLSTGELLMPEQLESLHMEKKQKVENCLLVVLNDRAESSMLEAEIRRLQQRKKQVENHAKWLSEYVANNLNGEKFKGELVSAFWRKSKAVVIDDVESVPEEFLKITVEPSKSAINDAAKNGVDISAFAHIEERNNMIIK